MSSEANFQSLQEEASKAVNGFVYRRALPSSSHDVRLEVHHAGGRRRIRVKGTHPRPSGKLRQTRSLIANFDTDDQALKVELLDTRLSTMFSALVDDFLSALTSLGDRVDAIEVLLDRMALWSRLFEEAAFDGLSGEEQRGLFCELLLLKELFLPSLDSQAAIEAWKAPTGNTKDFVHGLVAVEVKSRFRKGGTRVRISSETQLECLAGDLFLAVYSLDTDGTSGQSLPVLVDELRTAVSGSGVALTRFDDLLIQAGYLDIHKDAYAQPHYTASLSLYDVQNGFPRILPSDLLAGVSHAAYDLELTNCASFAVGPDRLVALLGEARG